MTPPTAGAIAIIQLAGSPADLESLALALGLRWPPPGAIGLRELAGLDTVLVARPTPECVELMPHAGPAVVRGVLERLTAAGVPEAREHDVRVAYPEARDRLEAQTLDALARAASPAAIEALLAQPDLWRRACPGLAPNELPPGPHTDRDRTLGRLIHPPLVAALGPANIGKSTLCNALAGRQVAVVADEPGTTRDHVGVLVELDGLVVRYVDTPGLRDAPGPEAEAVRLALEVVRRADLILLCGDPSTPPPPAPAPGPANGLRVCLRADLGTPRWTVEAEVSVGAGRGLESLAAAVRDRLAPRSLDAGGAPWRFWEAPIGK